MPRKAQTKPQDDNKPKRRRGRPPKAQTETKALTHSTDVRTFPLEVIEHNPYQPRTIFNEDHIRELAMSIKGNGLQEYPAGREVEGKVQLAYGHQRFMAFQQLAVNDGFYGEMPIVIREYTDEQMAFAGLEENRARNDLTPIEVARALQRIMTEFPDIGPTELGERIGLHKTTVSNAVRTLGLPEEVIAKGEEMGVSLAALREFLPFQEVDHVHDKIMMYVLVQMEDRGGVTREDLQRVLKDLFEYEHGRDRLPERFKSLSTRAYNDAKFDVNEFEKTHKQHVHSIHGLFSVTCDIAEWDEWQDRANLEQKERMASGPIKYSILDALRATDSAPIDARPFVSQDELSAELGGLIEDDFYEIICAADECSLEASMLDEAVEGVSFFEAMVKHVTVQHVITESDMELTQVVDPEGTVQNRRPIDDTVICFATPDHGRWAVLEPQWRARTEIREFQEASVPMMEASDFTSLVPASTKKPTVDKKFLPKKFETARQQAALVNLIEGLAKAEDIAAYIEENDETLREALGTRADIWVAARLGYTNYETLNPSSLGQIADADECIKRCAWGFALSNTSVYAKDNPFGYDMICMNKACFASKKRKLTSTKSRKGKEGIEREDAQVQMAATEIAQRGTMNLGRMEAVMMLGVIAKGSDWTSGGNVYWKNILCAHMEIPEEDAKKMGDSQVREALLAREEEELRYLLSVMLLERFRHRAKPAEWEAKLEPVLSDLGVGHVVGPEDGTLMQAFAGVEVAEPVVEQEE